MKICELNIPNGGDRASLVSELVFAGYKVSIDERKQEWPSSKVDYYVIVEDKQEAQHDL